MRFEPMPDGVDRRDFFISFNSADDAYASAIDAALRGEGFTTFYHPRDLPPGGNIPMWMDDALMNSAQTLALYSPDYTSEKAIYSRAERYATWWQDPTSDKRKLIPILLRPTTFTPLMAMISRIDVTGATPAEAAARVIERLKVPNEVEQRDQWRIGMPLPNVFRAAYRPNASFSGRFEALESLHRSLRAGTTAVIAGMGGIGKTTLAAEYCHRFGGQYGGVWTVRAADRAVMLGDLQELRRELQIDPRNSAEVDARAALNALKSEPRPWLLIYDNAPDPDSVREWLPIGATHCIITSRFTEFGNVGKVTSLDLWPTNVTADYLLARTGRHDQPGATRLAERLGGLPLAAEQAAGFLESRKGISFDEYSASLAELIKRQKPTGATGDYPDTVYAAFVKSLETLENMDGGNVALGVLRISAFLSPDGVELRLLTLEWTNKFSVVAKKILSAGFVKALTNRLAREDSLAALTSLSLLRQTDDRQHGTILVFHRLLLDVLRDWMGDTGRTVWGSAAVRLVNEAMPDLEATQLSQLRGRSSLISHIATLRSYAPKTGDAGKALERLIRQERLFLDAQREAVQTFDELLKIVAAQAGGELQELQDRFEAGELSREEFYKLIVEQLNGRVDPS